LLTLCGFHTAGAMPPPPRLQGSLPTCCSCTPAPHWDTHCWDSYPQIAGMAHTALLPSPLLCLLLPPDTQTTFAYFFTLWDSGTHHSTHTVHSPTKHSTTLPPSTISTTAGPAPPTTYCCHPARLGTPHPTALPGRSLALYTLPHRTAHTTLTTPLAVCLLHILWAACHLPSSPHPHTGTSLGHCTLHCIDSLCFFSPHSTTFLPQFYAGKRAKKKGRKRHTSPLLYHLSAMT